MNEKQFEVLKANPQQLKEFNEIIGVMNDSFKKNLPVLMQLVMGDVSNYILQKGIKEGVVDPTIQERDTTINKLATAILKDLESQTEMMMAECKEKTCK